MPPTFLLIFSLIEILNYNDHRLLQRTQIQDVSPINTTQVQTQDSPQVQDQRRVKAQPIFNQTDIVKNWDLELHNIKEFFQYVETPSRICNHSEVFGGIHGIWKKVPIFDGDKVICFDKEFDINPKKCLVYSFGINNEWSFDDALARFGCTIYAFDPTMNVKSHKRGARIHFYNIGIGNKDGTVLINRNPSKVMRFTSLMKLLGHLEDDVKIDYLKMDVEGAEIPFLEDVLQNSPHILQRIKQIGMEIHVGRYTPSRMNIFKKNYNLFK
ncbi:unnamed protein product, partial [Meganyctiphanes norvegica]